MKKAVLMVAMLAILLLVTGCGSENDTVVVEEADVVADAPIEELETLAAEAIAEDTTAPEMEVDAAVEEVEAAATPPETEAVVEEDVVVEEVEVAVSEPVAKTVKEPEKTTPAVAPDAVVVTVNGQKVTEKEVSEAVDKIMEMQKKRMPPGMQLPDSMKQQMRKGAVDNKVDMILLAQKVKEKGIQISDEQITNEIQDIADQQGKTMEEVEADIAKSGMTMEEVKEQIQRTLEIKALLEAQGNDLDVAEADAQKFYDDNPQYFEKEEQVTTSHILCGKRGITEEEFPAELEKIKKVQERLKAGEKFEDLAKECSTCPSAENGGALPPFGPNDSYDPAYKEASFKLEVGQVSDIVKSSFGYHLIKVTDKQGAGKTPFEDVKAKITQFLTQQKQQELWGAYSKTMHDSAVIEYSEKEQALRDELEKTRAVSRPGMPIQPAAAPEAKPAEEK